MEEVNEESISLSNMAPLAKKQTTVKKPERKENCVEEKLKALEFQVVEEVGVITPLEVHPSKLSDCISTYRYQRHPVLHTDPNSKTKDTK
jgi:hypothetical protein